MTKIDRRTWWVNGLWLLAFLLVFFGARTWQQHRLASGPAPALAGITLQGRPVSIADSTRPVLIHFWATWCRICSWEQDTINAIFEDTAVISIAMQSGDDYAVRDHVRKQRIRFPVINDASGALSQRFGVRATPTTFVVDGAGNIRFVEVGYTSRLGWRLRLWLARLGL